MAYFCRLYISSEALTSVLMVCDLFGLKIPLVFNIRQVQVCLCASLAVQTFSIEVFHHLNAPCPFVTQMSHRCCSGFLNTWEIIMKQKKETVVFLISS